MNFFYIYIKSLFKRKHIFKTRQNQKDLENFKALKLTKPVDNCNNFKLRRLSTAILALGWIFSKLIFHMEGLFRLASTTPRSLTAIVVDVVVDTTRRFIVRRE